MTRNPWRIGMVTGALILAVLGSLFVIGLLIALAFGADFDGGRPVSPQATAITLLAVIAVMAFAIGMDARWDRRHKPKQ